METKFLRLTHPVIPTITFPASQSYRFNGKCYQNKNQEMTASQMPCQWWFKMCQRGFPHQQGLGSPWKGNPRASPSAGSRALQRAHSPPSPNPAAWQPREGTWETQPLGNPWTNAKVKTVYHLALGFSTATAHRTHGNGIPAGKVWGGFPPQGTVPRGCRAPSMSHIPHPGFSGPASHFSLP